MLTAKEAQILEAIEAKNPNDNLEIVSVEIVGAQKSPIVRVFIDTEQGVSFDELAQAQVWIGELFDDLDPFTGAYTLEVSSPGIDRPLRTRAHFEKAYGSKVQIVTKAPIEGRSKFRGILQGVENNTLTLDCDGVQHSIEFEAIKKAHRIGTIDFSA